ncbi:coagulation factor 5/8 type domain-containing protein, partial [Pseudomonas sp. FW215-L1]
YELSDTIRVNRPGTVVLGLGFATLKPVRGNAAMAVADVDNVTVAGLLFDAGETESPVLLEVGPEGSRLRHVKRPTLVADVFFRVGGAAVG